MVVLNTSTSQKTETQPGIDHAIKIDIEALTLPLLEGLDSSYFPLQLMDAIKALIPFDTAAILLYDDQGKPHLCYDGLSPGDRSIFFERFFNGSYILSPSYQAYLHPLATGAYFFRDLAPQDFESSEYYHHYYKPSGLTDMAYIFCYPQKQQQLQITFGRLSPQPPFSQQEHRILHRIAPVLSQLAVQHWRHHQKIGSHQVLSKIIHQHIEEIFHTLGGPDVTDRERDVLKFILTGHSSESAAKALHISPGTERVHRRNLYAKLGISSHSELFGLFMSQLTKIS